jgi:hypothetical protein
MPVVHRSVMDAPFNLVAAENHSHGVVRLGGLLLVELFPQGPQNPEGLVRHVGITTVAEAMVDAMLRAVARLLGHQDSS